MAREAQSILEVLIARGGIMKGGRVAAFVVMWAVAERSLGHEPTMLEVIEYWNERPRTLHRYLAEFRELLPELGEGATPQVFVPAIREREAERLTRRANAGMLGRVPAPQLLVAA
jgi:hypothetical protein